MNENLAGRRGVEPASPLVEAARAIGTSPLTLVGDLERVRNFAAAAALKASGGSDRGYGRSDDELDLQYWTSVCRGM